MLRLVWLATVLRAAGLTVVEEKGWETRGHGDMGDVRGVLCHHTAGPLHGDTPSLSTVINGRPGLDGPLAQLFLARSGVWHVVAAGLCYHAGAGARGTKWEHFSGNSHLIGTEAENTGLPNDPWPAAQVESYARGEAALLKHIGASVDWCLGHKEYAGARKTDPSFPMAAFRTKVAAHL